ncbi:MAG: uracil-DNA glycosylase [Rhodobacterales bacterium]|nr:uracil-DNA glycosylase [Rhodobacterales bacterium]
MPPLPREPGRDCALCPRLVTYRQANRDAWPDWHNAPVPAFGPLDARLLVVGLAPGLKGANRTARPFTGDWAGDLLYPSLLAHGFARGAYGARPDDGIALVDCRITNAVRCAPPANKVTGPETRACGDFLIDEIKAMPNLRAILALGAVAHGAVLGALGQRKAAWKFAHGAVHALPGGPTLTDSYHCSRYNTNTGRLTEAMFHAVLRGLRDRLST